MARTLRLSSLESRAARERLKPRGKPYWFLLTTGLHLGFRKAKGRKGRPATDGAWVMRRYVGGQTYVVETIGRADDFSDADGLVILDFKQAQDAARKRMVQFAHDAAGTQGPITIKQVVEAYIAHLDSTNGATAAQDARCRVDAFILPQLGDKEVAKLRQRDIEGWRDALAKTPPRLRTKRGEQQQHREIDGEDAVRRRKSTANRILTTLKAALNYSLREGSVASDAAWKRVKPFKNADTARVQYLTVAQAQALIAACDADGFRSLVTAALATGARYGELARLRVEDFNADARTILIRRSKTDKARHISLTSEGVSLFARLSSGRAPGDLMLVKSDGTGWGRSHQGQRMRVACERAQITPPVGLHQLRHTYASLATMSGMPLPVLAKTLGHATTLRTEKNYAHLAPSYISENVERFAPRFLTEPTDNDNVRPLLRRR